MQQISIAVAGCGPAGLAAALCLHRAGHDVFLIDRFETPKPLGSGLMLQSTGLAVLEDLGLRPAIEMRGTRIARLDGRLAGSGRQVLDVRYAALGSSAHGLAVHRASLFGVLHEAVHAAGIPVRTNFDVERSDASPSGRMLVSTAGERLGPVDLVIDALGSRSPLPQAIFGRSFVHPLPYGALWASLPWPQDGTFAGNALEQRYRRARIMAGVLPIGRRASDAQPEVAFFWSLKQKDHAAWQQNGLAAWKPQVLAIWPQLEGLLSQIVDPAQLTFARYGHHTLPQPVGPAIAFIGDCAHSASPQLGQGANMALLDAWALAQAVETSATIEAALAHYARARRFHVALYQTLTWAFTPFYQSDNRLLPLIRDHLVAPLSRLPPVRRLLARLVAGVLVPPISPARTGEASPLAFDLER